MTDQDRTYTVACHRHGCGQEYTFKIMPMWQVKGPHYCLCGYGLEWRKALAKALEEEE
jgi:hypothetical protein